LYPTLKWYFWTGAEDKQLALQSRERIRDDAARLAAADYKRLYEAAEAGGTVPEGFGFLLKEAKEARKARNMTAPAEWDARALLLSFESKNIALRALEKERREKTLALKELQRNAVQLGLDLSGGLSIVLRADLESYEKKLGRSLTEADRNEAMEQALETLNGRIDKFGLTEPSIRRQGADQIYLEIPGRADPERINAIIMEKGSLTLRLVDEEATKKFNEVYGGVLPESGADPSLVGEDVEILGLYGKDEYGLDRLESYFAVKKEIGLDGSHIKEASVSRDNFDSSPHVAVKLDSEGGDKFWELTSKNVRKPLAIVLGDKVRSAPVIREGIRDNMSISGFNAEEANNLALTLRTAALPVELEVAQRQSIGASVGADYIRAGLLALLGGLGSVMLFTLIFYKFSGVNAVIAQLLNIYIMFSVLSAFNFTLTLPGIAGFILTIGMAVDANVIIFERIKEELRFGKTRRAAVSAGFDKAFWAVMDSNITTFIAALFLSLLGSGPIKGFAVSLAIGVFSSVFTSLFVSRLIFDFETEVLGSRRLSISWRKIKAVEAEAV
jgi:preprotein translocase subunit SecD